LPAPIPPPQSYAAARHTNFHNPGRHELLDCPAHIGLREADISQLIPALLVEAQCLPGWKELKKCLGLRLGEG
jgi:hypothetical protein